MSKLAKALTAAAGNAAGALYVEDVFSTYLYNGNGTSQTITNGIDLAGEGGLVWCKPRTIGNPHYLGDTERGTTKFLESNSTAAEGTSTGDVTAFNADGFSVGATGRVNQAGQSFASWSFRKQAGFFDVVTYTGDGSEPRAIAHNLGCKPGLIIIKNLSASTNWAVWSKTYDINEYDSGYLKLNLTDAATYSGTPFVSQLNVVSRDPSAYFYVKNNSLTNTNGQNYVAYLFADGDDVNAQVFGDGSDEAIIKCGSFTADGSGNATVDLGFEPQFFIHKASNSTSSWYMYDVSRSWTAGTGSKYLLYANANSAENQLSSNDNIQLTSTGFNVNLNANETHIYIAIRRPMKTPESGTEVFAINTALSTEPAFVSGFVTDMGFNTSKISASLFFNQSRLQGAYYLNTRSTAAEVSETSRTWDYMNGMLSNQSENTNNISYMFKRATGFFDVVCDTGTGTAHSFNHNLRAKPELIIRKVRSTTQNWCVFYDTTATTLKRALLNSTGPSNTDRLYSEDYGLSAEPTSETIYISPLNADLFNGTGQTYVNYLFATLAGVSKVGSYTGTGADLNVDCGFSAGARFILIKRTDSTGDWYVWDSVRGIVAGNDPYLLLNSTAAEVTSTDYIDPLSSGFTVTSSAPAELNASGGTYIFLAIA